MINYQQLPVYKHKKDILDALEKNQVIVIESPTGSGKTTQLPIILMEAGYDLSGMIGITQPRRIATLSICEYIKSQLKLEGNLCAYTMRFADTSDETTRIKIMTDGILLQELKSDPLLSRYSVIMVDEAHERSLNIDFILGLLKQITEKRKDLKVIISSATINTQKFSTFFDGAKIISIDAKLFPIEIKYINPFKDNKSALEKLQQIIDPRELEEKANSLTILNIVEDNVKNKRGDILIFCSGEYEIKTYETALRNAPIWSSLQVYPLYGRLSKEEQERVFIPTAEGKTKVVIATNIAETSITIDGITTVIDLGVAKVNFYNQKDFTSALVPLPISRSSAQQRAGRAGRTQEGTCYRLYSEKSLEQRPEFNQEEILRSDLAEVALRMSDLGIYDYENFPFITKPQLAALHSAEETLKLINAIDDNRHLTSIGEMMVQFPLLPRHSRVIVEAIRNFPSVLKEVLIATAFLSTKGPFLYPRGYEMVARKRQERFQSAKYGDFFGYLKLFNEYSAQLEAGKKEAAAFLKKYYLDEQTMNEIIHIEEQLEEIVSSMQIPITSGGSVSEYLTCLASGLIQYVCYQYSRGVYRSLTANQIYIHPSSSWFAAPPKFLLAGEIVKTSRMFARTVSPLDSNTLNLLDKSLIEALVKNKKEKKKEEEEKKVQGDFIRIFDRDYPLTTKKKKTSAIIPLFDLPYLVKKGFERGKVRKINVFLKENNAFTTKAVKLKDLVQEGAIVKTDKTLSTYSNKNFDLEKNYKEVEKELDNLFCPYVNNQILFVGLKYIDNNKKFCFKLYSTITGMIDDTYYALSEMNIRTKENTKLKKKVTSLLKQIDEIVDYSAE